MRRHLRVLSERRNRSRALRDATDLLGPTSVAVPAAGLRDQVHEILGVDSLARSGMERWTAQVLDVDTYGVLTIGDDPGAGPASRGAVA